MYFRHHNVDNSHTILWLWTVCPFPTRVHIANSLVILDIYCSVWFFLESLHSATVRCPWTAVASFWCITQDSRGIISTNRFFFLSPMEKGSPVICIHIGIATATAAAAAAADTSAWRWLCIGRKGRFGTNQRDRMLLLTCTVVHLPVQAVVTLVLAEIGLGARSVTQLWFGILCLKWCYAEMNKKNLDYVTAWQEDTVKGIDEWVWVWWTAHHVYAIMNISFQWQVYCC